MTALTNDLLRITGIGPVLAQRLGAAGLDSPAAIVAAGEAGLQVNCRIQSPEHPGHSGTGRHPGRGGT